MIVSESARERQEELQVNTVVIMDELRNPDDQGLGRAIRPVVDEKSWSARISFQETNLTQGTFSFLNLDVLLFTSHYHRSHWRWQSPQL